MYLYFCLIIQSFPFVCMTFTNRKLVPCVIKTKCTTKPPETLDFRTGRKASWTRLHHDLLGRGKPVFEECVFGDWYLNTVLVFSPSKCLGTNLGTNPVSDDMTITIFFVLSLFLGTLSSHFSVWMRSFSICALCPKVCPLSKGVPLSLHTHLLTPAKDVYTVCSWCKPNEFRCNSVFS